MTAFGVYPVADVLTAGDEVSSTYEGRHLTVYESELFHPYHLDTFVDKGEPVVIENSSGWLVGVAFKSATVDTDLIAVDTEGIWALLVYADTDEVWSKEGTGEVIPGDPLFIDRVTTGAITDGIGACALSKRRDKSTQIPFGYALGHIAALGQGVIAVKVHNAHAFDLAPDMGNRAVASGAMGWSFYGRQTDGESEGLCGYVDGTILGTNVGAVYGFGSWLCMDAEATVTGVITPLDTGVYSAAAQAGPTLYFAGQHHAQLAGDPAALYAWRLNSTRTVDSIIMAANAGSVGWVADPTGGAAVVGAIPLVTVGGAVRWCRLYASSA